MIIDSSHPKRYAVYVFFDRDGIVDEYNFTFLRGLRAVADRILTIVNGEADEKGLEGLKSLSDEVIVRPNEGFDITAYHLGLFHYGYEELCTFDEAVICNSTNFGPLYPFEEMFGKMNARDLDFWGITAFHEVPFDPFGTVKYHYLPQHVQSYFQVFRRDFMKTEDFRKWWEEMPAIHSYEEAIGTHEAVFTKDMADRGYRWDVYCDPKPLEGFTWDPLRDFPRYLIETQRCPVIKRRSFFHDYGEAYGRSGGEGTAEAFRFIRDHLDYDTDQIWANLLRTENMADLKKRMHFNYVLSSKLKKEENSRKPRVALILHIYYDDLAPVCRTYAEHMPQGCDFYITVPTQEKLEKVRPVFADLEKDHRIEYRITGNRGRDVAPFLVGCHDVFLKYDLVCKIHDKKAKQVKPMSIGLSWGHECFECTLKNETFVENVIRLFEENPRLGLLTPPVPLHGPYYPTTGHGEWGENFAVTKKLADELGLHVPMDPAKEPVAPLGSIFWVRTKALRPLFEKEWSYEDFPQEPVDIDATVLHAIERLYPFCAQAEGYYSGWLMSDSWARIQYDNWTFLNSGLEKAESERVGGWFDYRDFLERTGKS